MLTLKLSHAKRPEQKKHIHRQRNRKESPVRLDAPVWQSDKKIFLQLLHNAEVLLKLAPPTRHNNDTYGSEIPITGDRMMLPCRVTASDPRTPVLYPSFTCMTPDHVPCAHRTLGTVHESDIKFPAALHEKLLRTHCSNLTEKLMLTRLAKLQPSIFPH